VDATGAEIPKAFVRIVTSDLPRTVLRARADSQGGFRVSGISDGVYAAEAHAPGFSAKVVRAVAVREGAHLDLGQIMLDVEGCDGPGVSCDPVFHADSPPPDLNALFGKIRVTVAVNAGCAVDLNQGAELNCADQSVAGTGKAGLAFVRTGEGQAILRPLNNTLLSELNPRTGDCTGVRLFSRDVVVDGLGPGHHLCAMTSVGSSVHIFFLGEIEPTTDQLSLWLVVREERKTVSQQKPSSQN
jgi:hypothetical protein